MQKVYSVGQINTYIRTMFTQDFVLNRISVRGEVSNLKYHTSGHIYFSLKDAGGTIACVMFAGMRGGLTFRLANGQQIVADGNVNVYERDGKYQLYASRIRLDGAGELYERFLALKAELEEMGMFAPEYKKKIPVFVRRLGVVTAPTGAAVRDIINVATRRNPGIQVILYPAQVQGEGAAASVARGLEALDQMECDVIIVGRGGGSIEDLWAFNEEETARAIFACQTPVISAVGHEVDWTIADYVADLRAPTPSAAAELAVFDYRQFEEQRRGYEAALQRGMERRLERLRFRINECRLRLQMRDPQRQLNEKRQRLADCEERMQAVMERRLLDARHRLALASGRLHGLSPLQRISRGFGFVTDADGRRVEHIAQVSPGDTVTVRISDGKMTARVTGTEAMGD